MKPTTKKLAPAKPCYFLTVDAEEYGAGTRTFTFDTLEGAAQAQELMIWLDPEPCISSRIEESQPRRKDNG